VLQCYNAIALPFLAFLEFRQARKAVFGEHQIDAFHDDIVRLAILGAARALGFAAGFGAGAAGAVGSTP
jgi:hypothetical protein